MVRHSKCMRLMILPIQFWPPTFLLKARYLGLNCNLFVFVKSNACIIVQDGCGRSYWRSNSSQMIMIPCFRPDNLRFIVNRSAPLWGGIRVDMCAIVPRTFVVQVVCVDGDHLVPILSLSRQNLVDGQSNLLIGQLLFFASNLLLGSWFGNR